MFSSDFEKRRLEMRKSFKRTKLFVGLIGVVVGIGIGAQAYVAYKSGCFASYLLQHVCLSEPRIDNAIKNAIGK